MEVTIKTLEGQNKKFENIPKDFTVAQFKEKILAEMNIPIDRQRLIFQGRVLQDDKTLESFKVDGKVIHLVQRTAPPPAGDTSRSQAQVSDREAGAAEQDEEQLDGNAGGAGITFSFGTMPLNQLVDEEQLQRLAEEALESVYPTLPAAVQESLQPPVSTATSTAATTKPVSSGADGTSEMPSSTEADGPPSPMIILTSEAQVSSAPAISPPETSNPSNAAASFSARPLPPGLSVRARLPPTGIEMQITLPLHFNPEHLRNATPQSDTHAPSGSSSSQTALGTSGRGRAPDEGADRPRVSLARLRETYIRRQLEHARRILAYLEDPKHVERPPNDIEALVADGFYYEQTPTVEQIEAELHEADSSSESSRPSSPPEAAGRSEDGAGPSVSLPSSSTATATQTESHDQSPGSGSGSDSLAQSAEVDRKGQGQSQVGQSQPDAGASSVAAPPTISSSAANVSDDVRPYTVPLGVSALGRLVAEVFELQARAQPALARWQRLLESDPDFGPCASETQSSGTDTVSRNPDQGEATHLHEQCTRLIHLFSHMLHSLSQFIVDFDRDRAPRNALVLHSVPLQQREILIQDGTNQMNIHIPQVQQRQPSMPRARVMPTMSRSRAPNSLSGTHSNRSSANPRPRISATRGGSRAAASQSRSSAQVAGSAQPATTNLTSTRERPQIGNTQAARRTNTAHGRSSTRAASNLPRTHQRGQNRGQNESGIQIVRQILEQGIRQALGPALQAASTSNEMNSGASPVIIESHNIITTQISSNVQNMLSGARGPVGNLSFNGPRTSAASSTTTPPTSSPPTATSSQNQAPSTTQNQTQSSPRPRPSSASRGPAPSSGATPAGSNPGSGPQASNLQFPPGAQGAEPGMHDFNSMFQGIMQGVNNVMTQAIGGAQAQGDQHFNPAAPIGLPFPLPGMPMPFPGIGIPGLGGLSPRGSAEAPQAGIPMGMTDDTLVDLDPYLTCDARQWRESESSVVAGQAPRTITVMIPNVAVNAQMVIPNTLPHLGNLLPGLGIPGPAPFVPNPFGIPMNRPFGPQPQTTPQATSQTQDQAQGHGQAQSAAQVPRNQGPGPQGIPDMQGIMNFTAQVAQMTGAMLQAMGQPGIHPPGAAPASGNRTGTQGQPQPSVPGQFRPFNNMAAMQGISMPFAFRAPAPRSGLSFPMPPNMGMGLGAQMLGPLLTAVGGTGSLADLMHSFGLQDEEDETQRPLDRFIGFIMQHLSMQDLSGMIMSGDMQPLNRLQQPIREYLTQNAFSGNENAGREDERLESLASSWIEPMRPMLTEMFGSLPLRNARAIEEFVQANHDQDEQGQEMSRPEPGAEVDLQASLESIMRAALIRFVHLVFADSDRPFSDRVHHTIITHERLTVILANQVVEGGYSALLASFETNLRTLLTSMFTENQQLLAGAGPIFNSGPMLVDPFINYVMDMLRAQSDVANAGTNASSESTSALNQQVIGHLRYRRTSPAQTGGGADTQNRQIQPEQPASPDTISTTRESASGAGLSERANATTLADPDSNANSTRDETLPKPIPNSSTSIGPSIPDAFATPSKSADSEFSSPDTPATSCKDSQQDLVNLPAGASPRVLQPLPIEPDPNRIIEENSDVSVASVLNGHLGTWPPTDSLPQSSTPPALAANASPEMLALPPHWLQIVLGDRERQKQEREAAEQRRSTEMDTDAEVTDEHLQASSSTATSATTSGNATHSATDAFSDAYIAGMPAKRRKMLEEKRKDEKPPARKAT